VSDLIALGLGSNLPDRFSNLSWAMQALGRTSGIRLMDVSSVYETIAVGAPGHKPYLNAVCTLTTELDPHSMLRTLNRLESLRGRSDSKRDAPRSLDIDILLWGTRVIESDLLRVPHPRMHKRAFVLVPLDETAPRMIHPTSGLTVAELKSAILVGHPAIRRIERGLEVS
jgi:2-amino-4-hydroxy-6-hydroxymethyldihydropteridine diphosphokinase